VHAASSAQTGATRPSSAAPNAAGESAAERADRTVQEIDFLRTINQTRLTAASQQKLLALLQQAEGQLRQGEKAGSCQRDQAEKLLRKAKEAALAGATVPTPDEYAAATAQRRVELEHQGILTRLRQQVREFLQGSLSPEEQAAALLTGQALVRRERETVT